MVRPSRDGWRSIMAMSDTPAAIISICARATSGWVTSPATETYFNLDFMTIFQKAPGCSHAHLQIVLVGARSQTDFLDF
jgi:hypothetical protein